MIEKPYGAHFKLKFSIEPSRNWFELLIIDVHLPIEVYSKSQQWRQSSIL